MAGAVRFPIRFTGANKAMVALGITRSGSYVEVTPTDLVVRLSWAFRSTSPRSSVTTVALDDAPVRGWGAHGRRGVWLVNGSSSGIVRIDLEPQGRASVAGFPVTLRCLRVAVEDPQGLIAALGR